MTARRWWMDDRVPERTAARMLRVSAAELRSSVGSIGTDRWRHRLYPADKVADYGASRGIVVPVFWPFENVELELEWWGALALKKAAPLGVVEEVWCWPYVEMPNGAVVSVQGRVMLDVVPRSVLDAEPVAPVIPLVQPEDGAMES